MEELKVGDIIKERYELVKFLGSGSFGEVWLANDQMTGRQVALKIYLSLDPAGVEEFQREYANTADLSSPYLLTPEYFDVYHRRPFLVMKYCERGSASKLAGNITEEQLWSFIDDVAKGLEVLHGQSDPIVHQDIKPDNILVDGNGRFVITDFGISKRLRATMRRQSKRDVSSGAMPYMAPERFESNPKLNTSSDIWSLGASIYELATGELPFSGFGGAMQRNGAEIPNLGSKYSHELNALMQRCLNLTPAIRPSASELKTWAQNKTVSSIESKEDKANIVNGTVREIEAKEGGASRGRLWLWIALAILCIGIGLYIWNTQYQPTGGLISEEQPIMMDSISTNLADDTIIEVTSSDESKVDDIKKMAIPVPTKKGGVCNLPFNSAGCPYLYIKGSDRTAMVNRKSTIVNLYDHEYAFILGDDHPNGTVALITTDGYGHNLLFDINLSDDENELFFDEFGDLRPECNMQITAMDFNNDGEIEILFTIQSEDFIITNTYVYTLLPSPYRDTIVKFLGVAEGQLHMYVDGHNIIAPYGSQGLYSEYMLASNGRIINIEN